MVKQYICIVIKTNKQFKKNKVMKAIVVKFECGFFLSNCTPLRLSQESDCIWFRGIDEAASVIKQNNFSAVPFEIDVPDFSIAKGVQFDDTDYSEI